jgi:6-phosphofructokinase
VDSDRLEGAIVNDSDQAPGKTRDIRRVGMLFSGGPAPAANAVISACTLAFLNAGISVIGFLDGYEDLERYTPDQPLREGTDWVCLKRSDVTGIRNEKAIILRTSRANPGKDIATLDDLADPDKNGKLRSVFMALEAHQIDALISIGGDDTLKTANYLYRIQEVVDGLRPVRIIHLPKTIDNDYYGIDWTFGFTSAAHFAAKEIRNLTADAKSTKVWYVLELMGRKAGWLTYAAGIAGEATRMISVEDLVGGQFDAIATAEELAELMEARDLDGRCYGIVCVAEGLADHLPEEQRPTATDEHGNVVLGSAEVGRLLAQRMEQAYKRRTGKSMKVRCKQIGYETRCAEPIAFDIMLGSQLGVGAFRAVVEEGLSGHMVSVHDQLALKYVPFDELIDSKTLRTRIRYIDTSSDFYRLARALEYQRSSFLDVGCG